MAQVHKRPTFPPKLSQCVRVIGHSLRALNHSEWVLHAETWEDIRRHEGFQVLPRAAATSRQQEPRTATILLHDAPANDTRTDPRIAPEGLQDIPAIEKPTNEDRRGRSYSKPRSETNRPRRWTRWVPHAPLQQNRSHYIPQLISISLDVPRNLRPYKSRGTPSTVRTSDNDYSVRPLTFPKTPFNS